MLIVRSSSLIGTVTSPFTVTRFVTLLARKRCAPVESTSSLIEYAVQSPIGMSRSLESSNTPGRAVPRAYRGENNSDDVLERKIAK